MIENGNADKPKIRVECPCGERFAIVCPDPEIANNFKCSIVTGAHERVSRCLKCKQAYIPIVVSVQVMWGAQPLPDEAVQKMEGSRIITPELKLM